MAKRDVVADILCRLNAFIEQGGQIPGTVDGKVNVLALCRELGLAEADAQHFHRKDAIKSAVNVLAEERALRAIGARGQPMEVAEQKLEERISRAQSDARQDAIAATEASAAISALAEELRAAQGEVSELRTQNRALTERLRLVEECGLVFDTGNW
ncbi:hypothetical protein ACFQY5_02680 [Paeniroseomonas aquatica]|uniref:KfrA N-terminal DNA-binding domain-containing protein n=1 Tax=Paeniroseomonas aquatica TaxID=373043 RepID=A0ABT8A5J5_9PROT|nr:hypothetical protein [Paeniroseomonas aquatica]MDN3564970.1 hypothetical protein [Paeniroseomonas aquatica]